jgi:hypothetical protein
MQLCNRIYSKFYWRLNIFRAAHRSSSGALNCICSLWFIYPCGDRPLPRLSGKCKYILELLMMSGVPLEICWAFSKIWNNKSYYKAASCWYFYWEKCHFLGHLSKQEKHFQIQNFWAECDPVKTSHSLIFRNLPSEAELSVALTSWRKMYHWHYEVYCVSHYFQAHWEFCFVQAESSFAVPQSQLRQTWKFCVIACLSILLSVLLAKNLTRHSYYTVPADT